VSGGGGWGPKQGLLSLDPQTTFSAVSVPQSEYSATSLEEQQASALGVLARPGSLIQFYVAVNRAHILAAPDQTCNHSIVIQTVPSRIDEVPNSTLQEEKAVGAEDVQFLPHHLGVVSESGIYFTSTRDESDSKGSLEVQKRSNSTKIDLPYSSIYEMRDVKFKRLETEEQS